MKPFPRHYSRQSLRMSRKFKSAWKLCLYIDFRGVSINVRTVYRSNVLCIDQMCVSIKFIMLSTTMNTNINNNSEDDSSKKNIDKHIDHDFGASNYLLRKCQ